MLAVKGVVSYERLYNGHCNRRTDDSRWNWLSVTGPKKLSCYAKKGNKMMRKGKRMAKKAESIVEDAVDDLLEL